MKTITKNQYLQLVGLHALAQKHNAAMHDIEAAALAITGEDALGHTADALYGHRGLDEALTLLEIVVEESSQVETLTRKTCYCCEKPFIAGVHVSVNGTPYCFDCIGVTTINAPNSDEMEELSTLRGQLAQQGWQPIETAPKDTYVLCYWQQFATQDVVKLDPECGWTDEDEAKYTEPSHWMPLPAPPVLASPDTETK